MRQLILKPKTHAISANKTLNQGIQNANHACDTYIKENHACDIYIARAAKEISEGRKDKKLKRTCDSFGQ